MLRLVLLNCLVVTRCLDHFTNLEGRYLLSTLVRVQIRISVLSNHFETVLEPPVFSQLISNIIIFFSLCHLVFNLWLRVPLHGIDDLLSGVETVHIRGHLVRNRPICGTVAHGRRHYWVLEMVKRAVLVYNGLNSTVFVDVVIVLNLQ